MGLSIHEVININKRLAEINSIEDNNIDHLDSFELFIDNLHCSYIDTKQEFILPSFPLLNGPDFNSIQEYLDQVIPIVPNLFKGLQILPEPRPKKEIGKIFLVKEISDNPQQKFLFILSLDLFYLGGAKSSEILKKESQVKTASIRTSRIYFRSVIIPVDQIFVNKNCIIGFDPFTIKELILDSTHNNDLETVIKPFSEIFDELDFSKQEELICQWIGINNQVWSPGKVFSPVGIDYLSISLRLLEINLDSVDSLWSTVGEELEKVVTQLNPNTLPQICPNLIEYLKQFSVEINQSASGNICWKIFKNRKSLKH